MSREVEVLKLLYPKSIPVEEYEHAIQLIRLSVSAGHSSRRAQQNAHEERVAAKVGARFVSLPKSEKRATYVAGKVLQKGAATTRVFEYLQAHGPSDVKVIREALKLSASNQYNVMTALRKRGLIEKVGFGRWKVK